MEPLSVDTLQSVAENAYNYLNTQEGVTVLVGAVSAITAVFARWLLAEFGLPAAKAALSGALSLVRKNPSLLVQEITKSLGDPAAVLSESATGNTYDELMTNVFVVKYDRDKPLHERLRSITTSGRDVLDVLTPAEKKSVASRLQSVVRQVKARDVALQRDAMLALLRSDLAKADPNRR